MTVSILRYHNTSLPKLIFVVTRCYLLHHLFYQLLPLVLLVLTRCSSMSIVFTRCTNHFHLSFFKLGIPSCGFVYSNAYRLETVYCLFSINKKFAVSAWYRKRLFLVSSASNRGTCKCDSILRPLYHLVDNF